jgi:hypothetical protein
MIDVLSCELAPGPVERFLHGDPDGLRSLRRVVFIAAGVVERLFVPVKHCARMWRVMTPGKSELRAAVVSESHRRSRSCTGLPITL